MTKAFDKIPVSVAAIMDGNRRWAAMRGLKPSDGHRAGVEALTKVVRRCDELGIKYLTVYAFSTENWNRDRSEINGIISLLNSALVTYVPKLLSRNVRVKVYGDLSRFDMLTRAAIEKGLKVLENNTGLTLCICLSYGGRAEIAAACQSIVADGVKEVTEDEISKRLYSRDEPDPDMVIRTGGEKRISNFLLWQSAYSEFYFSDCLWPDFDENELDRAVEEYSRRKRRFGS